MMYFLGNIYVRNVVSLVDVNMIDEIHLLMTICKTEELHTEPVWFVFVILPYGAIPPSSKDNFNPGMKLFLAALLMQLMI